MTRVTRTFLIGTLLLGMLMIAPMSALAAAGGNAAAAKACQKDGFKQWTTADGKAFTNTGQCTSYAARGGVLKPVAAPEEPVTLEFTVEWDLFGDGTVFIEAADLAPGSEVAATQSGTGLIAFSTPVAIVGADGTFFILTNYDGCAKVQFSGLAAGNVPFVTPTYASPNC